MSPPVSSMVPAIPHHAPEHWPSLLIAPYLCPDLLVVAAVAMLLVLFEIARRARVSQIGAFKQYAALPLVSFTSLAAIGIVGSTLLVCFAPRYLAQATPLVYLLLGFGLYGNGQQKVRKLALPALIIAVNLANQYGALFPSLDRGPGIEHSEPEKAHERSHEYERYLAADRDAVRLLSKDSQVAILATSPFGHMLGDPRFGYVDRPLNVACPGMKREIFPFTASPEEAQFQDPIYVRDRYANRSIIPALEPEDEILFDDGLSPPMVIYRKPWSATLPDDPSQIESWLRDRGWVGETLVDCIRHRLTSLRWAGHSERATAELKQLLSMLPESFELRAMWIGMQIREGKTRDAESLLRQARADFPDVAWFAASLARLLLAENRTEEAAEPIETALQLSPNTPELLAIFAELRDQQGRWKEAEEIYRPLADRSNDPELLIRFGDLLLRMGKPSEAHLVLRRGARLSSDDPVVLRLLAKALLRLNRPQEAIAPLRKVVVSSPSDTEMRLDLAFALYQTGESSQAIALLRPMQAQHAGSKNLLAWILATDPKDEVRDEDEALRLAEELANAPGEKDPSLLDTLAAAYAAVGRYEEAATTQEKYLSRVERTASDQRLAEARARLELYRQNLPYRHTVGKE